MSQTPSDAPLKTDSECVQLEEAPSASSPSDNAAALGDDATVVVRRKVRKKRSKSLKKSRKGKIALIVLAVVVALLAVLALVAALMIYSGNESLHNVDAVEKETQTLSYGGHSYKFNEDVVSILVLGIDKGDSIERPQAKCADVNMLVTMDTKTNAITVIAIPRDSQVNVDLYDKGEYVQTQPLQLATAYAIDVGSKEQCAENSLKSVRGIFYNLPIDYYFVLNIDALEEVTNAVGGVRVKALDTYPGAPFDKGDEVLLQGEAASRYVQYRDEKVDYSAQGRQKRQVQFLKALLGKLRSSTVGQLMDVYDSVKDNTHTNLGASELSYLVSCFASGAGASTQFTSVTGTTKMLTDADGLVREHVFLDNDSVMKAMMKAFYVQVD